MNTHICVLILGHGPFLLLSRNRHWVSLSDYWYSWLYTDYWYNNQYKEYWGFQQDKRNPKRHLDFTQAWIPSPGETEGEGIWDSQLHGSCWRTDRINGWAIGELMTKPLSQMVRSRQLPFRHTKLFCFIASCMLIHTWPQTNSQGHQVIILTNVIF